MTVMWQVRLRMRVARPRARGRHRLIVVPSSAKQAETNSSSGSSSSLCSALATAERSSLPTRMAASRSVKRRMSSASPTGLSRIRSSTSRTL